MSLSLTCACGARFEVEETFAGQTVSCPECQNPLRVAVPLPRPLRTSGFAVASVVLALVLAFTGVGTILAVVLGLVALLHIAARRNEVTGTGYALFGIATGTIFTVLFALAVIRTELFGFDLFRQGLMGRDLDFSGPLEVAVPEEGFALKRPTPQWGLANASMRQKLAPASDLMLANLGKDAYVVVTHDDLAGRSLEEYRDQVIDGFRTSSLDDSGNRRNSSSRKNALTVRQSRTLARHADYDAVEVLLDVRMEAQPLTFLFRVVRPHGSDELYLVQGWAPRRRFASMEKELRAALDSLRILKS